MVGAARSHFRASVAATFSLAITLAPAQERQEFKQCEIWLADAAPSRALLEQAMKELMADPSAGFEWLAKMRAVAAEGEPRRRAVESLATHAVIDFVRRKRLEGIRFVGQYAALQRLEPYAGDLIFGLLVETPQWYPHTHRERLVRPLRDLLPKAPSEERIAQVVAMVESQIEPEDLRRALACLLAQWGVPRYAKERVDRLREATAEGDADERVRTMGDLAELQYELLDYRAAASTHRALQALADASKIPLTPTVLYSAACAHALIGDVDRGIAALERCAELQTSSDVDPSRKLVRSLWENDPEIAPLRADPRFGPILARAFPGAKAAPEGTGR